MQYFYTSLGKRFEYLRSCQCLLSDDLTTLLHSVFPKEGVSLPLHPLVVYLLFRFVAAAVHEEELVFLSSCLVFVILFAVTVAHEETLFVSTAGQADSFAAST